MEYRRPVLRVDNFTTFMYQLLRNYGNLNLMEPLGPVQTFNGSASPVGVHVTAVYEVCYLSDEAFVLV